MRKGFRINGHVYNITIVEEVLNQKKGECTCTHHHLDSSNSISSSETVVEETFFSARSIEEGDDYSHSGKRWDAVPKGEDEIQPLIETKWKHLEERAQSDRGCQNKGEFSFTNEAKRAHGVSEGGAALIAINQVKVACKMIQQSLVNLMEGVQVCNSLHFGPKQGATQVVNGGVCSKEVSEGGPVIGCNGEIAERRCATEHSVAKSSSPLLNKRMRETGYGEHLRGLKLQESNFGMYPCHAIHRCSEEEGSSLGCEDP